MLPTLQGLSPVHHHSLSSQPTYLRPTAGHKLLLRMRVRTSVRQCVCVGQSPVRIGNFTRAIQLVCRFIQDIFFYRKVRGKIQILHEKPVYPGIDPSHANGC